MAEDVVIRAEGLGKKYVIGHAAEQGRYVALRDVIARGARNFLRKTAGMARGGTIIAGDTLEEFWALKDVSFEAKRGEVVGVIGRNGAGKSTLLKILSRITEPSEGRVTINGRIASLLEVGTGFHPELTGHENIYLNGAILGMTRAEIRKKFDEIVAFAEVKKFLDTPVKRYSSGMYVRLAFAVAAHLEPEILVVDEVLAVGDVEFQRKCLGKMSEVAGSGKTVLFVSHYLAAVRSLCQRALLLDGGAVVANDNVARVIDLYLKRSIAPTSGTRRWSWDGTEMPGDDTFRLRELSIIAQRQLAGVEVPAEEPFEIAIEYEQVVHVRSIRISLQLITAYGEIAFTTSDHSARTASVDEPGIRLSKCLIPGHLLNIGTYTIRLSVDIPGVRVVIEALDPGAIHIIGHHNGGSSYPDAYWPGVVSPRLSWTVEAVPPRRHPRQTNASRFVSDESKIF
jgi:lipopolysaccharide transport system ATP-binding protein